MANKNIFLQQNISANHGNEIEDIISNRPSMLVKWGTVYFLFLVLFIVLVCSFIQYPEIVPVKATLTSIDAPKAVITKVPGKLIRLLSKEDDLVKKGEVLGFIESRADAEAVIRLSNITDTVQQLLQNHQSEKMASLLSSPFLQLGEVQQSYQNFMQSFILFEQYLSRGYYLKKKKMLQEDIDYLQRLHQNLVQQKIMQQQDIELADTTLAMNKRLLEQNVIARLDYRNEKSKFINKKMSIRQVNGNIISNESNQHEKQKEIVQLENEIAQQEEIFFQALNTLKAQIEDWKSKYLLIASITGKIYFAGFLQQNQQLQANQEICFIDPGDTQYYAVIYISQANFGRVKPGQDVLLKFSAYPFREYGTIKGTIDIINHITTDSGYLAKVILPDGLQTNYKKQIQFREGLKANGEIITANISLLQRFYFSVGR